MELIDIYDENNNYLGYCLERKEAHDKNLWHYHVSAWIMNYDGEILLQQRSFSKKKNPGKWTKTGGHVSSNLGIVDLTIAIHKVFDSPKDKIIFDVGHQSYTHKILTGRAKEFDKLRQMNGLSGFQKRKEVCSINYFGKD